MVIKKPINFFKEPFKGYKKFRNEILDWAKLKGLDTLKCIYHPDDGDFIKAFEIEWNKDPKCKDISLEIFTHWSVLVGEPVLTGKDSKLDLEPKYIYGDLIPLALRDMVFVNDNRKTD